MSHKAAPLRVLFISFLVLLSTGQPGSVSAGTHAIQSPAFTCDGVTEIPVHECEALVALYNSTNGPGWSRNDGWLTASTPCNWYGVTCETGHVVYLGLDSNQLSGAIPPALGNLDNLQVLGLSSNQLSGAIPPALGNLANLQWLYLYVNQLSGALPRSLMNLQLVGLLYDDTHLCEPPDAAFQAWLDSILVLERTGLSCKYAYLPFCAR
jgi:hypothetical protein